MPDQRQGDPDMKAVPNCALSENVRLGRRAIDPPSDNAAQTERSSESGNARAGEIASMPMIDAATARAFRNGRAG